MVLYKFRVFIKFQWAKKSHLLLIFLTTIIFSGLVFNIPVRNSVQYALAYQHDDISGEIDTSQIGENLVHAKLSQLEQNFPVIEQISQYYITTLGLLYNNKPVSDQLVVKVEFHHTNTTNLAIRSLWYRSASHNSINAQQLHFDAVNITQLQSSSQLDQSLAGVLTLPIQFSSNFTSYHFGITLNPASYAGLDQAIIQKHFDQDIKDISERLQQKFGDALIETNIPVQDALQSIEPAYPTIILQNFILTISVLGGIMVLLYFLLQSSIRGNLKQYETLFHRGYTQDDIQTLIPVYFILFYSVLTALGSILLVEFEQQSLQIKHLMPSLLVAIIAFTAAYAAVREYKSHQPRDATDYELRPSIAEYVFLGLTVISFLVNIYLNLPAFRYTSLLLVLAIYCGIGIAAGGVIYKILQLLRRFVVGYLAQKDQLNQSNAEFKFLNIISIRQYRKHLKLAILFGIVLVIIVAHTNVSYQLHQQTSDNTTILLGQYSTYQETTTLNQLNIEYSGLLPVTLSKLGVQLQGVIVTSDTLFDQFPQLQQIRTASPALYIRNDVPQSQGGYIFDLDAISTTFQLGSKQFDLSINPASQYSSNIGLLNQFKFLLFVDSSIYQTYNSSVSLLISSESARSLTTEQQVEQQLSQPVIWNQFPPPTPVQYSMSSDISSQLDFPIVLSISVVIIGMLGYIEPQVMVKEEIMIMRKRGYLSATSVRGVAKVSALSVVVFFLLSTLCTWLILLLLHLFSILPGITINLHLGIPFLSSALASLFWFVGSISSYYQLLHRPLQE